MRASRTRPASRPLATVLAAVVVTVCSAVLVPSPASAAGIARASSAGASTPARAATYRAATPAPGNGLRGRAVPTPVGPPRRSCGRPLAGRVACQAVRPDLPSGVRMSPQATGGAPYGLSPADLQLAYSLPSATAGTAARVYVVDAYDDPNAENDLQVYRAQYGLPTCTTANGCFQKLNQRGQAASYPLPSSGWAGEIALDLAMVSAVCPRCGITLVEADDDYGTSLYSAVQTAVSLGATYVSMSWGGPEAGDEPYWDSYFDHPGVVFAAATGDAAFAGGVSYPASSPYVVAVGGTSLRRASTVRGWTETAWSLSGGSGAGSGCSASEARPAWQTTPATSVCARRAVADVSAVADPATGVAVYDSYGSGGWAVYGGTSAATPIIASVYALAGRPGATDVPPAYPYAHRSALWDITSGSTGSCSPAPLCTAGAGWDGPTGLGSPHGVAAFSGVPPAVLLTAPGAQSGRVGTPASLALHGTDTDGTPLTWGAVGLPPGLSIAAATGVVSGTPTAVGTFTVTVTAVDGTGSTAALAFVWSVASRDVTPPTAALTAPTARWSMSTSVRISWGGADAASGVAYYQLQYRRASYAGDFSPWMLPATWRRLTSLSLVQGPLAKGFTYCWSVRAIDRAGNTSAWSPSRCTTLPLDDRALWASRGWGHGYSRAYWARTTTGTVVRGRTLTRTGAEVRRVALVATRCATCGVVGVYVRGALIGRISLAGRLAYRVVYTLPPFSYRTGAVTLKVLSSGRRVSVDALLLSRL